MVQGARGETILTVKGQEYRLLFTNRALAEAERRIGKNVTAFARAAMEMDIGIGDLAALLLVGLQAAHKESHSGGRPTEPKIAWDLLDEAGFAKVAEAVCDGLAAVLSYDPDADEEGGADDEIPPADGQA